MQRRLKRHVDAYAERPIKGFHLNIPSPIETNGYLLEYYLAPRASGQYPV
jgi:hypothetical protein